MMVVPNASPLTCVLMWTLMLTVLKYTECDLQAQGCDQGWTDYKDYCYIVIVADVDADIAKSKCEYFGATVSSVWSIEEKNFINALWQFPKSEVEFMWLGLRESDSGDWVYDDDSTVNIKQGENEWSVFDYASGMPTTTSKKCVALRISGTIAFLDCNTNANAFVCKKALPRVFITYNLLNQSNPMSVSPTGQIQLFERMFPPVLTSLPADSSRLAEDVVTTEVGCAFRCFSEAGCQVFQVSCETSKNCETFQCLLYSDLTR